MQEQLLHPAAARSEGALPTAALLADEVEESEQVDPKRCCACLHRFRRSTNSVLVVVSLAMFVDLFAYCLIIPVIPLFVKNKLHGSSSATGGLFASYAAGLLLATPLSAYWSDKAASRRLPMLVGLGCMAVSTLLFGFASSLWQLAVARAAQGMSAAVTNTIGLAMVADVVPTSNLPVKMGVVMAVNSIGGLAGPPLGGALYQHVSYQSVFLLCGSLAVLDLVLRLVLIDDGWMGRQRARIKLQAERDGADRDAKLAAALGHQSADTMEAGVTQATAIGATVAATGASPIGAPSTPNGYGSLPGDEQQQQQVQHDLALPKGAPAPAPAPITIWGLVCARALQPSLLGVAIMSTCFTGLEPLLALHFDSHFHSSSSAIGLSNFAIAIPYMVSAAIAAPLQERGSNPKLIMSVGLLLFAAAFALFWLPHSLYLSLLPMSLFGLAMGAAMTPGPGEMGDYLTKTGNQAAFAQGFAVFNLAYALGMFAGPLLSGVVYQYVTFQITMLIMAGLSLLGAVPLIIAGSRERRESRDERARVQAASAANQTLQ